MGISGLLPLLKSIQVNTHIKQYAGKVVGIDAYVWLHKGAFSCAWDLALGNHTTKYIDYAMHRIKMLRHYGVEPYVVFDGDYLPSKLHTENSRASKRAEYLSAGMRFHAQKQNAKATEQFQKCIDITPEMAYRFILALRKEGIAYVVAPYEADAQLAYLEKREVIQAIITEDSDLLVFGCKTLLLKMGQFGDCVEIKRERFGNVAGPITLHGFTDDDFRHMAILSGCDYLESINGVGLITAHRLLRRFNKNVQRVHPPTLSLTKVVQSLRMQIGTRVPPDYMDSFHRANSTFKHQRVFCPEKECLVMWNEPEQPLTDEILVYIGVDLDVEIARGVANGDLHPMTKAPIASSIEDKENIMPSKPGAYVSTYKPKPPTPNKSIRSFFSPRSKSLQDITPSMKRRDNEKANTTVSTPKMLARPQSVMKRCFTAVESEETIAVKRARKYLGPEEDNEVMQSPFFLVKQKIRADETPSLEKEINLEWNEESSSLEFDSPPVDEIMDQENSEELDPVPEQMTETIDQLQVSESPPHRKLTETIQTNEDEVIPDSPAGPIRSGIFPAIHSHLTNNPTPQHNTFPPSPPSSRATNPPPKFSLPSRQHTPILHPGMKKVYIPRPSRPETPTLTPEHSVVVQGWKDRFFNSSKHSNTISDQPITPLHTPVFRRRPMTSSGVATPTTRFSLSRMAVEQIEEVSPPKGRSVCLDQFRFTPR